MFSSDLTSAETTAGAEVVSAPGCSLVDLPTESDLTVVTADASSAWAAKVSGLLSSAGEFTDSAVLTEESAMPF